jgi:hypothetical protein
VLLPTIGVPLALPVPVPVPPLSLPPPLAAPLPSALPDWLPLAAPFTVELLPLHCVSASGPEAETITTPTIHACVVFIEVLLIKALASNASAHRANRWRVTPAKPTVAQFGP